MERTDPGARTAGARPMPTGHYEPITLRLSGGPVELRHFDAPGTSAAITVGGVGGGWDSPAMNLYDALGAALQGLGIRVLRVKFRRPGELDACVADVLAGIEFLCARGVERIGLVGHSFGGAVVVTAGAQVPEVRTVVTLATQSAHADASRLASRSLLLLHGTEDEILPPEASLEVQRKARGETSLEFLRGAGHGLDEAAEAVRARVQRWLVERLA